MTKYICQNSLDVHLTGDLYHILQQKWLKETISESRREDLWRYIFGKKKVLHTVSSQPPTKEGKQNGTSFPQVYLKAHPWYHLENQNCIL